MINLSRQLTKILIGCALMLARENSCLASPFKLGLGVSFLQFTKTSDDGTVAGSVPVGVAGSAGYFFANRWAGNGVFEMNLEMTKQTAVFIGGQGVVEYYLAGGMPKSVVGEAFSVESFPKFNAIVFAGAGGHSYNFNAFESSTVAVKKRKANNTARGSVMGPVFGAALGFGIARGVMFNVSGKMFKGLTDEITPAITNIGFGAGVEVLL